MANTATSASRRRAWLPWAGLALALFIAVELVVRHLPPDGASVTRVSHVYATDGSGEHITSTITTYAAPHDQAIINALDDALNTAPLAGPAALQGDCATVGGYVAYTITLTWHGFPVQVWNGQGSCGLYSESSGGLPNMLWSRAMPQQKQATLLPQY